MTKKRLRLFILICVTIAILFCGCMTIKSTEANDEIESTATSSETESTKAYDETAQIEQDIDVTNLIDEGDEVSGDLEIPTPYVTLKYPSKWLKYLKTEKHFGLKTENNIVFFAQLDDREEVELFTIHFNEDGEFPIGVLDISGESVYMAFTYFEFEFDDSWTEEEKNTVYAMQEEINYIIEALKSEPNFVPEF